jgi:hypothetical protein
MIKHKYENYFCIFKSIFSFKLLVNIYILKTEDKKIVTRIFLSAV